MNKYSLLTVDLNEDVSTDARNQFYAELQKRKWKKISDLTTLWYATWDAKVDASGIIGTTKKDVEDSAQVAKVEHYDAATAICGTPVVWKK